MTAEEFLGIKEYLKHSLKIEIRNDLEGISHLVLLLEDTMISQVPLEIIEEYDDEA